MSRPSPLILRKCKIFSYSRFPEAPRRIHEVPSDDQRQSNGSRAGVISAMFCSAANPGFLSNIFINSLPLSSILLHYKMQIEWCLDPTLQRRTLLLFLTSIPLCVTSVPTQLTSGSSPSFQIYSRPRFLPSFIV